MVGKIVFWAGFGMAVRFWQRGIQRLPYFGDGWWAYPVYGGTGASFGYWLKGVDDRQTAVLAQQKEKLLDLRRRRAELESANEGLL